MMPQSVISESARQLDSESLFEVVAGDMKEKEVGANAVFIASFLVAQLGSFVRSHDLGRAVSEMLFFFNDDLPQRRPDVAFISYDRWPKRRRIPDSNAWPVVPDLAVEVVSPTNAFDEIVAKVREYFTAGVQRVWVVSPPERQVYVYDSTTHISVLAVDDSLSGEPLLPGFQLSLAELFDIEAVED